MICDCALLEALQRCADGEDPSLVLLELEANAEVETL
jgi:hypothetical protein